MPASVMASGMVHHKAERLKEAAACYHRMIYAPAVETRHALVRVSGPPERRGRAPEMMAVTVSEASRRLAGLAYMAGKHELTRSFLRSAVKALPHSPLYRLELAQISFECGDDAACIAECRRAVALDPVSIAWFNLGLAAQKVIDPDLALVAYHRFLVVMPKDAAGHLNTGVVLQDMGCMPASLEAYERAVSYAEPQSQLFVQAQSNAMWARQFVAATDREIFDACRLWARDYEHRGAPMIGRNRDPDKRIRIGYACSRFHHHVTMWSIQPIIEQHDRERFEIVAYKTDGGHDQYSHAIEQGVDLWRDVRAKLPHDQAAVMLADRLDILVSVTGYLLLDRAPFLGRVAPVQVTYINHVGTTGLKAFDYRITDRWFEPEGASEDAHTEQLIRLDTGCNIFRAAPYTPDVEPTPALRNGYVTFGSFNQLPKVTDAALALWSRVLARVPGSRLLVKAMALNSDAARRTLTERAVAAGIPADRFEARPGQRKEAEHLGAYRDIDIALDPIPFTGGVTTFESLWMGVPVNTMTGPRAVNRICASMVSRAGYPELVASSQDDYVETAAIMAADIPALAAERKVMRSRVAASDLCNAVRHTAELEDAYRAMWRGWCRNPWRRR